MKYIIDTDKGTMEPVDPPAAGSVEQAVDDLAKGYNLKDLTAILRYVPPPPPPFPYPTTGPFPNYPTSVSQADGNATVNETPDGLTGETSVYDDIPF